MPRGKTAQSLALIDACAEILTEIQPATVRAVCYQLFIRGLIASMAVQHTKRVSAQLVYAREQGIVPWEAIVDETRAPELHGLGWEDPAAFIASASQWYAKDRWVHQPRRFEVWSEKGTVRGILAPVLEQYGLTFRVVHGFASATAAHDVATASAALPMALEVCYVGDWDPSGLYMSEVDLPTRLAKYGANVQLRRLALLQEDTADENLPGFLAETKVKDSRYAWFVERYGSHCWELDAMNPVILRAVVADAIAAGIDQDAWTRCARVEQAEQRSMRAFFDTWPAIAGPVQE